MMIEKMAISSTPIFLDSLNDERLEDAFKQELFLYVPDEQCQAVAFKGSSWLCAKKLKRNFCLELNIYDVYKEIRDKIKVELKLKTEQPQIKLG